jgi:hypothetical protein
MMVDMQERHLVVFLPQYEENLQQSINNLEMFVEASELVNIEDLDENIHKLIVMKLKDVLKSRPLSNSLFLSIFMCMQVYINNYCSSLSLLSSKFKLLHVKVVCYLKPTTLPYRISVQ